MAERPRLLVLESLPVIAGGQHVLLDMLPALADYHVMALLPGPGPLADALGDAGVDCHFAPMADYTLVRKSWGDMVRFPPDQLRLAWRCYSMIRRLKVDLIYANSSRAFVWGTVAAAAAGRPIVWHLHNLLGDVKTIGLVRRLGRWDVVRSIVAVSRVAADQFPELGHKVRVIPSGVDTQVFRPDRPAGMALRRSLVIPEDARVVGMVGDLIPLKGQHTLVEAAELGAEDIWYVIAGAARGNDAESQVYADGLQRSAGPRVVFPGRLDDLPTLLNALDLLVVASERETGPLVLLEALACGVPVISTPVGRCPELLTPEALFAVGDAQALAAVIQSWLSSEERLAAASQNACHLAETSQEMSAFVAAMRMEIGSCLRQG
jgi:glycosyltransferase involved in cell wall biosynthesis